MKDSRKLNDQELDKLEHELKEFFKFISLGFLLNRTPMVFNQMIRGVDGEKKWKTYEYHIDIIHGNNEFGRSINIDVDKDFDKELKNKIWLFIADYWFRYDHDFNSKLGKKLLKVEIIKDYSPAFIVLASSVESFYGTAQKFKNDAIALKNNSSTCTPSFHLLSSIAFELLPKVLVAIDVCNKYKDKSKQEILGKDIISEISKGMSSFKHNLKSLYEKYDELMKFLGIESIEEFPRRKDDNKEYFAWEYRFKLKGDNIPISIKDVEAIRYGSFAKKKDICTSCIADDKIIELLNRLDEYILKKMR